MMQLSKESVIINLIRIRIHDHKWLHGAWKTAADETPNGTENERVSKALCERTAENHEAMRIELLGLLADVAEVLGCRLSHDEMKELVDLGILEQ